MSQSQDLRCAAACTTVLGGDAAADELVEQVRSSLAGGSIDLAVLTASAHFDDQVESLANRVAERLEARALVGATAEAVICGPHEYESQPAAVLWAASLPGARVASFHLNQDDLKRHGNPAALAEHLGIERDQKPSFVLLGDPVSINILEVLARFEQTWPGRPAFGGMASAGFEPRQNALIFDGHTLREGLVGVAVSGPFEIEGIVSQGCRPIGSHFIVTRAERNVIYQLGGRPALEVVHEIVQACEPRDQQLLRTRGLLIGCAIDERQPAFSRGDFVIRNPLRVDGESGALEINDFIRTGQTIQFQVRDSRSADEDLEQLLLEARSRPAAGALLFSCNGRGTRLFSHRHHDARAVSDACEGAPLAGLFAAGEIGPIGPRNFLHGHTASIALFRPAT